MVRKRGRTNIDRSKTGGWVLGFLDKTYYALLV